MESVMRFIFKLTLLAVAVLIGFSFLRQLLSPVERPTVTAGPGGGGLPTPLPRAGAPAPPVPGRSAIPLAAPPAPPPSAGNVQDKSGEGATALVEPPIDINKPITEAIQDQIVYRLLGARTQGNRLTVRLLVTNKGPDRLVEISSLPWSKTLFYNERSEVYWPENVQIGNSRGNGGKTRAMLVAGVPAITAPEGPTTRAMSGRPRRQISSTVNRSSIRLDQNSIWLYGIRRYGSRNT